MTQGAISYVPQQAWIQNMTLRDNILFSKTYNRDKYEQVLDACALVDDLKILAGGDQTEIGERVRRSKYHMDFPQMLGGPSGPYSPLPVNITRVYPKFYGGHPDYFITATN